LRIAIDTHRAEPSCATECWLQENCHERRLWNAIDIVLSPPGKPAHRHLKHRKLRNCTRRGERM
jgi:hypothetical protein